jgi:hypothetical protein
MNTLNDKKINSDYLSLSQLNELNEKNRIIISFGESLSLQALSIARINEYSWEINGGDFNESGTGEGLLNVVFQNPGQYTISLLWQGVWRVQTYYRLSVRRHSEVNLYRGTTSTKPKN